VWINVPSTTSAFARVAQVSTLASGWLSEMFAQSAVWNTRPLPSKSWLRQWKRVAWMKRLFGRTLEPSTAARGVALWIHSLRATRVSRSAKPAVAVDSMILGTCGRTSIESLARLNRDSCFSKTCPITSVSDLGKSSRTWRDWVTRLRRAYTARKRWVRAKNANDSSYSLWPTPTARDYKTPNSDESQARRNKGCSRGQQLMNFVAHSFHLGQSKSAGGGKSSKKTGHLPRLNPRFVCWLMGWPEIVPIGSGFSATEWCRYRRRMRSALCGLLCEVSNGASQLLEEDREEPVSRRKSQA
jgi:hypothetical protein